MRDRFWLAAVLTAGFLVLPQLMAETLVFRGGDVLAAELTRQKVRVANLEEENAGSCAALVTVHLQPGRTLSVHDYSLVALGGTYPCVAIREEDGSFDAAKWHWGTVSPQKKYGMLFLLKIPASGNYQAEKFTLLCNAPGTWTRTSLPFTDRQNGSLTAASRIPSAGTFPAAK